MAGGQLAAEAAVPAGQAGLAPGRHAGGGPGRREGGGALHGDARAQHLRGGQHRPGLRQGGHREGGRGADGAARHLGHPPGQAAAVRGQLHPGRAPPRQAEPPAADRAEHGAAAAAARIRPDQQTEPGHGGGQEGGPGQQLQQKLHEQFPQLLEEV